jgi:large subunit ribosomal protein L17
MKHLHSGRIFSRTKKLRSALLKTLVGSFIVAGKIKTTEAKAKEIRPLVEKLITSAKKKINNPVELNRFLAARLSRKAIKPLVELAKKYSDRQGGYLRITKVGQRKSDGAKMAIIELV